MGIDDRQNAATQAKKRWNAANYTQLKVHVDPVLASGFKADCAASGVSIASVLKEFMADYINESKTRKPVLEYSNRRKRRSAILWIVRQLELVKAGEEKLMNNTPENLHNSVNYEMTAECIDSLVEAIEILAAIY
jgi:hypothetical protein